MALDGLVGESELPCHDGVRLAGCHQRQNFLLAGTQAMQGRRSAPDLGLAGRHCSQRPEMEPMIDFANSTIVKLGPSQAGEDVMNMLIKGEESASSPSTSRASLARRPTTRRCPTPRSRHDPSRPPAGSTGMVNWNCGSADSARCGSIFRAGETSRSWDRSLKTTSCRQPGRASHIRPGVRRSAARSARRHRSWCGSTVGP